VTSIAGAAVITGAAGGIGAAVAERLVADGYDVALLDRDERVEETRSRIGGALGLQVDVVDAKAVRAAVDRVVLGLGRLDVVVNCAGTAHRESFEETTPEVFMADVNTNLLGTFLMCQAAVFPHMKTARTGRLVNIASVSGKRGGIGPVSPAGGGGRTGAGYAASKAGVINLTRWIARETGPFGICCNAIAPGLVMTPMTDGHTYDVTDIPLGRGGRPEEIADAVSWLAGPGAAYVHGAVIDVDGGLVRA
jgi:3-oxoacyl-[acyl-carrier protein] reductase